ncbi:MAG: hypothetical protein JSV52_15315 [Candidatus Zixiibacteriota bacterium]|nr:MAG: hypothetical protein JSV52_15315 [candidate division Zixibacteria bacterium]
MMKDIAPGIFRQRLLIEGYYSIDVDREGVERYLFDVAEHLGLRTYGEAVIFSPSGLGKEANQGFDAFVPLVDSGISAYIWVSQRFFSVVLYSCKEFDVSSALEFTAGFFGVERELVHESF